VLSSALIEGFASSCLVQYFDDPSPFADFHREWWELCTSPERFVAICAPRGHSKSTTITIVYTLTAMLFRERKYALIVADTESQASLFLGQIKQILYDSKEIHKLFNLRMKENGEPDFEKDTETDMILNFNDGTQFRIIAKGAEQKLRGMLWSGTRPDLIVIDDLMNEELVMNKDRRDKLRRWVYGSLIPCRSEKGIIRFVGTPMNLDDPLESLMPKENVRGTVVEPLRMYSTKKMGMWKSVKYRAHDETMTYLLWPERKKPEDFIQLREDFKAQGIPEVYSCEYMCNPVDDSIRFFKKTDLVSMHKEDFTKDVSYYIAGDFAISEKERADYTAIVVGGMDSNGVLHIRNVIRERMDGLTIVQTLLQLQNIYKPEAFGIEEGQITKAIGPFLNRAMIEENIFINLIPLKPHKSDKISRARSIQARMRAGGVKMDKQADWYEVFETELLSFPRSKHDDMVDALSYLGLIIDRMAEGRTPDEVSADEYDEEFRNDPDYIQTESGRSGTTGY
jgi:predicted phage terminase large subunit-like protein